MASDCLTALDETTIDQTWTDVAVAERVLDAADAGEQAGTARSLLALGGEGLANSGHTVDALGVDHETPYSDVVARAGHDPSSEKFGELAAKTLEIAASDEDQQAGLAAEWGRAMSRLVAEADLVAALDGWEVAPVEKEAAQVDVWNPDTGETAQVATYIRQADDDPLAGKGKSASVKFDGEAPEGVDYYIVLHDTLDGEYGVGVNDLNDDGIETDWGRSAENKAQNAVEAALEE